MGNHKRKERHRPKKKVNINHQKNKAYPLTKCFHIHEPHFILIIYYKGYIIRLLRNHSEEYLNIKVLIFQLPLSATLTSFKIVLGRSHFFKDFIFFLEQL